MGKECVHSRTAVVKILIHLVLGIALGYVCNMDAPCGIVSLLQSDKGSLLAQTTYHNILRVNLMSHLRHYLVVIVAQFNTDEDGLFGVRNEKDVLKRFASLLGLVG